jgi:hypothetical protein
MEFGALRDDARVIVMNEAMADHLATRMAHRFHAAIQKSKGGKADGTPGANPGAANQWGGKAIIKYNPSSDERQIGIQQEATLITWSSPDGLPHYVTVEVGRLVGGVGGPGLDTFQVAGGISTAGNGGGTFPLGHDKATGAPLSYRACAEVLIGTPGTMQDTFYMDINRGQRFTALASYVAITVKMDAPPVNQTAFQGNGLPLLDPAGQYISGSMAVYATLGMAVAPTLAPIMFTQYIDMNNTGQGGIVLLNFPRIIPPRANVLLPVMASSSSTININFFDNSGRPVGNPPVYNTGTPNALGPTIDIPQDAYSLLLNPNPGSTGNFSFRLIYQLSV